MISDLDKNKSGSIDFEEFLDMMTARMSDKDTREDIAKVFRLFDDDTSGSITLRNLRRVAKELGETMTDEELQEMVDRADSNGDGAVSMDDFYNIMTKKTFAWGQLVSCVTGWGMYYTLRCTNLMILFANKCVAMSITVDYHNLTKIMNKKRVIATATNSYLY